MAHSLVDDEIQSCIESAEPITIMLPRHQTPGRRKLNMKKKIMSMVIAAAAMALSLVGCGVDINSIGLPPNVVMEKGETQQLEIEYGTDDKAEQEKIAEAASKLTIEWTSSDEEVVTVDATGLITAVGAGEADVTASAKDVNISSTTHVKVVITPTGVEAPETLELVTNGENSKNLDAKMTPEDATEVKLAYTSSDESVATVDENGLVTAVADGECTITTYVVADAPATAETAAVVTDEEKPTEGENAEATADSETVTMPDNLDAAFGVVPEGLSATTKVTVTTKVESITLDKTEGILNVGNTVTITAAVTPEEATNPAVTWSSSDESVATVDETGKVTAVATGNATITATSEDDSSVSANYELTVQQKKAAATTTKNNYSGSTSAGASTAPSYTAPTQPVTPSAPAPVPAPAPAPDPAPAPAPAPDPAPAPAEPSQPSGGNSGGGNFDDGSKPEDSFGQSSGIDWTQDNSNGSLDGGCVRC
jgi:alpha-L-fucosidase 2